MSTSINGECSLKGQILALGEQQRDSKASEALPDSSGVHGASESAQGTCTPHTHDCTSDSLPCSVKEVNRLSIVTNSNEAGCKALPS